MTPLFSKKYLSQKLQQFKIDNFEQRQQHIADWQKMIAQGIVDDTKEESLQADFLNKFFGDALNYTYNRSASVWHLEKEYKSQTDSTKADGALGFFTKTRREVLAVIELKDAKTDLDKKQNRQRDRRTPVEQAFDYASKSGGQCRWVIVSNFKEIRLYSYSGGQGKYELFYIPDLFKQDNLQRLFFLMERERLIIDKGQSPVDILYAEREAEQQNISKRFYAEYKQIRLDLFQYLKKEHPQHEDLVLLNKTQKLIDRVIFVLFCEDIGLMPPKVFSKILTTVADSFALSTTKLWDQLKGLFNSIDKGNLSKNINKFNGGLFETDNILDSLSIQDNVLEPLLRLMEYDFSSDLNVNILGHIFEQSISDLEQIRGNLQGKRKKDGIFYTPEYITKYIVEQAVGGWLADQRQALGFNSLPILTEKDYASIRSIKRRYVGNEKVQQHIKFLEAYREKLRNIKVLDPACGSGAFLNQVFDFLYNEGQSLNADLARLQGGQASVFDLSKHILTNNLYGVDINEESVEITKLSLWLKTADRKKTLTSLDNNILCGNSLIDDVVVAGDKAFKWEQRFAEIMEGGGFDVVVGNPPYVIVFDTAEKQFYEKKYKIFKRNNDLYSAFFSLNINILKTNGFLGLITPNSFLKGTYFYNLRKLLSEYKILKIVDFTNKLVFKDANVFSAISILSKTRHNKENWTLFSDISKIKGQVKNGNLNFIPENRILKQVEKFQKFEELFLIKDVGYNYWTVGRGKKRGNSIGSRILYKGKQKNINDIPYIKGSGFNRYAKPYIDSYLIHDYQQHLDEYNIFRFSHEILEIKPKIVYRQTSSYLAGTIEENGLHNDKTVHCIINKPDNSFDLKFVLVLFNSRLLNYIYKLYTEEEGRTFAQVKTVNVKKLPFKNTNSQKPFIQKADQMLALNKKLQDKKTKFLNRIKSNLEITKITKKLTAFHNFDFKTFITELKKQKVKLTLVQQDEWEEYFTTYQIEIRQIQAKIDATDKEIDQMVYQLYGLTDEQIEIVEASQ